jgi:hypothetical protein
MYRPAETVPTTVDKFTAKAAAKAYLSPDLFEIGSAKDLLQGTSYTLPYRDYRNQWRCWSCQ